ncbi:hypothetical protein [Schleiferilactobacillus harbinensis]|uniref:hypothetical protein n=1 Tax=Schleiferilactobacillus harbinensis TaxID=304207 RepID=UPI0011720308|nr:hypothetical protein [Schleiferilactobacillus harbinensis]GEK06432.1 hypothetical protein LHA01_16710 [Schleiferilactobacillus harbinensis]
MSYKLPDPITFKKWLDGLTDDEREQIRQELRHDLEVAKKFDEDQKKWYGTSKSPDTDSASDKKSARA